MRSAGKEEWVGSSAAMRKRHEPSHVWLLTMNKENGSFSKDEKLKVLEEYTRRGNEEANSQGLLVSFFLGLLSFLSTRYLVAQSVGS